MLVVVFIVLVVLAVCIVLVTNWGGQSNSAIQGLFKFFESVLSGKQVGAPPNIDIPVK